MTKTLSEKLVSLPDDPFAVDNIVDPYPLHEKLREAGPVVWLERYGVYAVARYAPVYEILTDFETYCSSGGLGPQDIRKQSEWRPPRRSSNRLWPAENSTRSPISPSPTRCECSRTRWGCARTAGRT